MIERVPYHKLKPEILNNEVLIFNQKITTYLEGNYVIDIVENKNTVYALTQSQLFSFTEVDSLGNQMVTIQGSAKKLSVVNDKIIVAALDSEEKTNPSYKILMEDFTKKPSMEKFVKETPF